MSNGIVYPDPEQYPEAKEHMTWRLRCNKKQLNMLENAACIIQSSICIFLAKTILCHAKREVSVNTIQRMIHGINVRTIFLEIKKLFWAACFTQWAI